MEDEFFGADALRLLDQYEGAPLDVRKGEGELAYNLEWHTASGETPLHTAPFPFEVRSSLRDGIENNEFSFGHLYERNSGSELCDLTIFAVPRMNSQIQVSLLKADVSISEYEFEIHADEENAGQKVEHMLSLISQVFNLLGADSLDDLCKLGRDTLLDFPYSEESKATDIGAMIERFCEK